MCVPILIAVNSFEECYKIMWLLKEMLFAQFLSSQGFEQTINS